MEMKSQVYDVRYNLFLILKLKSLPNNTQGSHRGHIVFIQNCHIRLKLNNKIIFDLSVLRPRHSTS